MGDNYSGQDKKLGNVKNQTICLKCGYQAII